MVIFVCISTAVALVAIDPYESERRRVRYDAESLASWLNRRMSISAREESEFKIYITYDEDVHYSIHMKWLGGINGVTSEQYEPRYSIMSYDGTGECTFSGVWYTLTPAATFVLRSEKINEIRFDVTVSGTGYVSVTEVDE